MLEKRLDFLTPLQSAMKQLADGLEESLPKKVGVEIELKTTPLQEVEASLGRNQSNLAAMTDYSRAEKQIETIGPRLGYLLQKIESGKDITGNAALEVERLNKALDKAGEAGRKAADSLGDKGLADKITSAEKAARSGEAATASGGGGGVSVGNLMSMMRNPEGAMMQGVEMALSKMVGNGGILAGGAGAALGIAGAVAGGLYGGWKINERLAADAESSAGPIVADARLSRSLGRKLDFRGLTYDQKRESVLKTIGGESLSDKELRSVLQSMGIGSDNWTSGEKWLSDNESLAKTGMLISRTAYGMGVSTEQLASMVGAEIRSGAVDPDSIKVNGYLRQIAGATEEAAKLGVTANEKLAVIASLDAKTVSSTGMLTSATSALNLKASSAFQSLDRADLKGQLGASALSDLAGAGDDESRAIGIGMMLGSDGRLLPEFQALVDKNDYLKALQDRHGDAMVANMLLDDESVRAAVNQRGIKRMSAGGVSPYQAGMRMGVRGGARGTRAIYAGMWAPDILTRDVPMSANGFDENTPLGKEAEANRELLFARHRDDDRVTTGYTAEAAKALLEASTSLKTSANIFGRMLSDGTLYQALNASAAAAAGNPFGVSEFIAHQKSLK